MNLLKRFLILTWMAASVDGFTVGQSVTVPSLTVKREVRSVMGRSPRDGGTNRPGTTTAMQTIPVEVATCLIPTCGGFFSREFGVSYAYGAATSLTAWYVLQTIILPQTKSLNWVAWHAMAIIFYGIRLNTFLFVRGKRSKRIREMRKRIEERAEASGSRLSRVPFVISCAYLYYGLCAPLYQTAAIMSQPLGSLEHVFHGLVGVTWLGFLIAALGDFAKSTVKARRGEHHLVTGGLFRVLRHPNYTGEILGWTASSTAGVLAFVLHKQFTKVKSWWYLSSNLLGVMGINFVLMLAARNLEKRQAEMYGSTDAYKKWIATSWSGFVLPEKTVHEEPHIEVNDQEEDGGTGI